MFDRLFGNFSDLQALIQKDDRSEGLVSDSASNFNQDQELAKDSDYEGD